MKSVLLYFVVPKQMTWEEKKNLCKNMSDQILTGAVKKQRCITADSIKKSLKVVQPSSRTCSIGWKFLEGRSRLYPNLSSNFLGKRSQIMGVRMISEKLVFLRG